MFFYFFKKNIERLVLEVKPFSRLPTSSWKALIQARLYVAEYGGPFRLVMGEVFELSTNNFDPPLELRIDQKIFAIKLEMRYIMNVIAKCLCSKMENWKFLL
uniref:Uncharacterized protein n=1 Tax=Meloidogyne enterolobii TaxID=390850 RepID=A0A6V7WTC8_MELEN|nr:unnamed protein product [Meloidogyne enterolobii]